MNFSQFTGYISWLYSRFCLKSRYTDTLRQFCQNVVKDILVYPEYSVPEEARKKYLSGPDSGNIIAVDTHGAISHDTGIKRTMSQVVRRSSISASQGRLLFRVCRFYKPVRVFELGTSAGISTLYLASGSRDKEVITVEGNLELASKAAACFKENNIGNIRVVNAPFAEALKSLKEAGEFQVAGLKLVFIDGDHSYKPVTGYYSFFKEYLPPPYILIFHDINWSGEMKRAWVDIAGTCKSENVADLFSMGIVFNGL